MDAQVDYSTYTLKELYTEAEKIDREAEPQRAKEIDELIIQREQERPVEVVDEKAAGNKATRMDRLIAAIVDAVIILLVSLTVSWYFDLDESQLTSFVDIAKSFTIGIITTLVVQGYLMHKRGQTIGKYLINMRMETLDGSQASFARIFGLRVLPMTICAYVPVVGIFIAGLVNVLLIFGKERRCLHDYIAGTKVCYVDDEQYEQ